MIPDPLRLVAESLAPRLRELADADVGDGTGLAASVEAWLAEGGERR